MQKTKKSALVTRTFCLDVIPQVRPGPVSWTHSAPGEDLVPEQAHEVEEDGKCHNESPEDASTPVELKLR